MQPAEAAGIIAAASEAVCNQDVGITTGVVAYRVAIDYLVVAGGGKLFARTTSIAHESLW